MKFDQNKARKQKEFKSPEGTRRRGPPFPINLSTKSQESMDEILSEREEEGGTEKEEAGAGELLSSGQKREPERGRVVH